MSLIIHCMAYSTLQGIYNNGRTEKAVIEKKKIKKTELSLKSSQIKSVIVNGQVYVCPFKMDKNV